MRRYLLTVFVIAAVGGVLGGEALINAARAIADRPAAPADAHSSSGSTTPAAPQAASAADAHQLLAQLDITRRRDVPGYERDLFGDRWADIDGNGCDQRDDVLLRDAVADTVITRVADGCEHDVIAGTWVDPYTGRTLVFTDLKDSAQAQAIQIDHVVPIAEAWRSGAHAWDEDRRVEFANTLDGLLAVDGPTNAAKGDDDPAAWRPRQDYQCAYATRWITTKHQWDLKVDRPEASALTDMLATC